MNEQTTERPYVRLITEGLGDRRCHVCSRGFDGNLETPDGPIPGRRFLEFRAGVEAVDAGRV